MSKVIPFRSRSLRTATAAAGGVVGRGTATYNGPSVSTQAETILQEDRPFLVGEWLVEPTLNRLTRGEVSVQLESKAIDVLLCLVAHAGQVVGKDTLFDTVWQTEFVSDNTLTRRVAEMEKQRQLLAEKLESVDSDVVELHALAEIDRDVHRAVFERDVSVFLIARVRRAAVDELPPGIQARRV